MPSLGLSLVCGMTIGRRSNGIPFGLQYLFFYSPCSLAWHSWFWVLSKRGLPFRVLRKRTRTFFVAFLGALDMIETKRRFSCEDFPWDVQPIRDQQMTGGSGDFCPLSCSTMIDSVIVKSMMTGVCIKPRDLCYSTFDHPNTCWGIVVSG